MSKESFPAALAEAKARRAKEAASSIPVYTPPDPDPVARIIADRKSPQREAARDYLTHPADSPAAQAIRDKMVAEIGLEMWNWHVTCAESEQAADAEEAEEAAEAEERAQAKPKPRKRIFKKARRVSKSPETWRCLANYPTYEISNHGRVRSLDRANPNDSLKPRWKWLNGHCIPFVRLYDGEGKVYDRMVGKLLIAAGFMDKPKWMKNG